MKRLSATFKSILATLFFSLSLSALAVELPDPELLAKQYLKDLCTLNEQEFTRKYMLTQSDVIDLIGILNASEGSNERLSERLSDSLEIRGKVLSMVVESYRSFKTWQKENNIDSSKVKYHSCDFELQKKRELPFYGIEEMDIYFLHDTSKYVLSYDEFLFMKSKWIGGDFDGIDKVDSNFKRIYDDYNGDYTEVAEVAMDTAAAADYYYEEAVPAESYEVAQPVLSKKQLKIQKKLDAYTRKMEALMEEYDKLEY